MTTDTLHPLAAEYLQRLRRAGRGLPAGRLRELLAEIEGHLSEAIDPSASDAQALTVLDKLGEPEAIVAAETPDPDELPDRHYGLRKWAAIILLLLGGFILGVGWFAGLILLWNSRAWTEARQVDRNARRTRRPRDQRTHRADRDRRPQQKILQRHRRRRTALHQRRRTEHPLEPSRSRGLHASRAGSDRDLGLSCPPRSVAITTDRTTLPDSRRFVQPPFRGGQAATRSSSTARSRALSVSEAARLNSARASSSRPSFASRSPRTVGSRW